MATCSTDKTKKVTKKSTAKTATKGGKKTAVPTKVKFTLQPGNKGAK